MQVLDDGELAERARAAAQQHDARLEPDLGVDVGERLAVEADDTPVGNAEAADRTQQRRLPGAVGTEQREHLAPRHLEPHVEQHLDGPVAEVEVAHLQHRDLVGPRTHSFQLRPLFEQLFDGERDVALEESGAVHEQQAADRAR